MRACPRTTSTTKSSDVAVRERPSRIDPIVAGLLLLTLVLRIGMIIADGERLQSDPDAYVRLGTMLAEGKGYCAADGQTPTAYRPILYPLLLALPLSAGIPASIAVAGVNLIAAMAFVIAVVRLASALGLNRMESTVAGFVAALDPMLIRYTTEPMTENVCAALLTLSVAFLIPFLQRSQESPFRPHRRNATAAGFLLGLSALCRPIVLVCIVLMTAGMMLIQWRAARQQPGKPIRRVAWMILPAAIAAVTVSPWIVRNAIQFHALIPATSHGGYTLLLGNNSVFYDEVVSGDSTIWDGDSLTRWQTDLHEEMKSSGIDVSNELEVDHWMYAKAKQEIKSHPFEFRKAIVLRWKRFWALTPASGNQTLPHLLLNAVGLWYGALSIGLLIALVACRRNASMWLMLSGVVSFLIVHSFYWTNTRMRAPLTGMLVVISVAGWFRGKQWMIGDAATEE